MPAVPERNTTIEAVMVRAALASTLVAATSLFASASHAERGTPCAQSHAIVGQCFVVHGRMFFPNGNPPVRISRLGTKRILGVLDGAKNDASDDVLPADLRSRLGPEWDKYDVFGDFEVCPLTQERPGHMQFVCLKRAQHVNLVTFAREPRPVH
jgi:hypothetical protein